MRTQRKLLDIASRKALFIPNYMRWPARAGRAGVNGDLSQRLFMHGNEVAGVQKRTAAHQRGAGLHWPAGRAFTPSTRIETIPRR